MKIISYKIDAFGSMIDQSGSFETDNINCLKWKNGTGKSTLADFIRVMLFGMKTTKAGDKEMGDREHYLPDSKNRNIYGGEIVIETNGTPHTIIRKFDAKSRSKDIVELDGKPFIEDEKEQTTIGSSLLNIDEEAFLRTTYFTGIHNNKDARGTDSINRNMGTIVSDFDTVALKKVLDNLNDECKKLKTDNRSKTFIGEVNILEAESKRLTNEIERLENTEASLGTEYAKINTLEAEIGKLKQRMDARQTIEKQIAYWKQIEDLQNSLDKCTSAITELKATYPKGLPAKEDTDSLKNANSAITKAQAAMTAFATGDSEKAELEQLEKLFEPGFDTEEFQVFKDMETAVRDETMLIEQDEKREVPDKELELLFAKGTPSKEQTDEMKAKSEKYRNNESTLQSMVTMHPKTETPVIGIATGALLIIAGIAAIAMGYNNTIGLIGSIAGLAVIVVSYMLKKQAADKEFQQRALNLKELNIQLENELKRFYAQYGFYDTAFVDYANSLAEKISQFESYTAARKQHAEELEKRKQEAAEKSMKVGEYKKRFNATDLAAIEKNHERLKVLLKNQEEKKHNIEIHKKAINEQNSLIETILEKYGLEKPANIEDAVTKYREDLNEWNRCEETIKDNRQKIDSIKSENNLSEKPVIADTDEDFEALERQQTDNLKTLGKLRSYIEDTEKETEKIGELKARLEETTEKIKELEHRHKLLELTRNYIEKADKNIKDRYIGPVRNCYGKYMKELMPKFADEIEMDTNYTIKIKANNKTLDSSQLSDGERTCLQIALRIAIIDNMYKNEKPFLVMDDPFTELDEQNMHQARTLLTNINKHYQIIYFCCHESRTI